MPERTHDNPAPGARLPYRPALDGLRALAVLAVLLYHADLPWAPGGFLGVEIFFVLSGYLITALLLAEWHERGRIDLATFWVRRARRLLPALFALLGGVMALAVLFLPDEVAGLRGDALAAAGYLLNWRLVFEQKAYFETIGRPPLLQHLWSLAVEEQVYLLWPLLFAAGMRGLRRGGMLLAVCVGAAAATGLMALLYEPDGDIARIYYGTDTRAAGFLAGAALAFVRVPDRRPVRFPSPLGALSQQERAEDAAPLPCWRRKGPWDGRGMPIALVFDIFGCVALSALAWWVVAVDEFQPRLYQGGFAAVALLAAVVVAAASDARARLLPRVLGWGPLRWAGLRSYSIYLWHWPIFMLTRPQLDISLDGAPLLALRLAVTLTLAELSYRCVELPIRGGALGRSWRALRASRGADRWRLGVHWAAAAAASLALALALGLAAVKARPPIAPAYLTDESVDAAPPGGVAFDSDKPLASETTALVEPTTIATQRPHSSVTAARLPGFGRKLEGELEAVFVTAVSGPSDKLTRLGGEGQAGADRPPAARAGAADPTARAAPLAAPSPQAPAPPTASAPMLLPAAGLRAPALPSATAPMPLLLAPQAAAPPPSPHAAVVGHVLAIGDSVMIGGAKQLGRVIRDIEVDAKVSRQASAAIKLVRARHDAGRLGDVVVIHIGSNGPFSARQFDELMAQLADVRRVVIVTVKVPRRWEGSNNTVIVEGVKRYPNAVLVDWRAASGDHPQLFRHDGIHLRPDGARLYADLIAAAVNAPNSGQQRN